MSGPFLQIRLHIKLYQPAPPGRTAENDRGDTLPSSGHVRQSVTVDFGEGSGMGHSCDIDGIMTAERYKFAYVVKSAGEIPRPSGKVSSVLFVGGSPQRSAESREGKECVSTCRSRGSPY